MNENVLAFDLTQLIPAEAKFTLSSTGEKEHVLKPYTLRVQLWAARKWEPKEIENAINTKNANILSQIAWELLKDKSQFLGPDKQPDYEVFLDAVVNYTDRSNLVTAVFESFGMSLPVLEKLAAEIEAKQSAGKPKPQPEQTGENSSISSPAATPDIQT